MMYKILCMKYMRNSLTLFFSLFSSNTFYAFYIIFVSIEIAWNNIICCFIEIYRDQKIVFCLKILSLEKRICMFIQLHDVTKKRKVKACRSFFKLAWQCSFVLIIDKKILSIMKFLYFCIFIIIVATMWFAPI